MAVVDVYCPHCHQKAVCKMGFTAAQKQRYLFKNLVCGRTFILNYSHNGCVPGIDQVIVDMAMNGSGIRDTSRVLEISQTTIIETLKKKKLILMKSTTRC